MIDTQFEEIAEGVWSFSAGGGPNSGVIVGGGEALIVDLQPDGARTATLLSHAASVAPRGVRYVALTHFHGDRRGGCAPAGALIAASRKCRTEIRHRLDEPYVSTARAEGGGGDEMRVDLAFKSALSVFVGPRRVDLLLFGPAHSGGDAAVWVRDASVMFSGDVIETGAAPYIGDASGDGWIEALDLLAQYRPACLTPGRGPVATDADTAAAAVARQRDFVDRMWRIGRAAVPRDGSIADAAAALEAAAPPEWRDLPLWRARLPFAAARLRDVARGRAIAAVWSADAAREVQSLSAP